MEGFRRVHLPSLVVGAAVIVGVVTLTGMTAVQSAIVTTLIRVKYVPDPNDIVNLADGTPYVVPEGKLLIITDWSLTAGQVLPDTIPWTASPTVRVNGVDAWAGYFKAWSGAGGVPTTTTGGGALSNSLTSGIRADAGQTVTLDPGSSFGSAPAVRLFASGYLAKANP